MNQIPVQEYNLPPAEPVKVKHHPIPYEGRLRAAALRVPAVIRQCTGIFVFGKRIKSLVFTTDMAIIRNVDADAVFAVHPFTPQPTISNAIVAAADIPVFVGVGGGSTLGVRMIQMAVSAETQGAVGVVVNTKGKNENIATMSELLEVPVVVTVVSGGEDVKSRIDSGASILNVSAAAQTPEVVREIRTQFPKIPIIATGGPTDESILETIHAGANAITWTPPSTTELFRQIMVRHRETKTAWPD